MAKEIIGKFDFDDFLKHATEPKDRGEHEPRSAVTVRQVFTPDKPGCMISDFVIWNPAGD